MAVYRIKLFGAITVELKYNGTTAKQGKELHFARIIGSPNQQLDQVCMSW